MNEYLKGHPSPRKSVHLLSSRNCEFRKTPKLCTIIDLEWGGSNPSEVTYGIFPYTGGPNNNFHSDLVELRQSFPVEAHVVSKYSTNLI